MKDLQTVLRQKELDVERVRREIQAPLIMTNPPPTTSYTYYAGPLLERLQNVPIMVWLIWKPITLLSGTCVYPNLGEGVRQESAGSCLINESEWRLLELIEGGFCKDLSWRIRITLIL